MSGLNVQIERLLKSPRQAVYKSWTSADEIAHWHCGSITSATMELESGGTFCLNFVPEEECSVAEVSGTYREVVPDQRVVYSWKWNHAQWDSLVSVDFEDHPDGTLVKIHHGPFETADLVDGHETGWINCLDGLKAHLQKTTDTLVPPTG